MGTARAEDPVRKRFLLSEEAKAVPMESAVFCQSVSKHSTIIRMVESHTKQNFHCCAVCTSFEIKTTILPTLEKSKIFFIRLD